MSNQPIVSVLPDFTAMTEQQLTFILNIEKHQLPVQLVLIKDGEDKTQILKMDFVDSRYQVTVKFRCTGLFFFYFDAEPYKIWQDDDGDACVAETGAYFQLTIYDKNYVAPAQLAGGILYQIFPDRFAVGGAVNDLFYSDRTLHTDRTALPDFLPDATGKVRNNDYYGGNFRGIIEKIPYLKTLGVTGIYLNPIAEAHSNHRYDTADYKKPDPLLGTEAEFSALCAAAHAAGMIVILDGVYNHTGADSVYFNRYNRYPAVGAYQSKKSPYYSWYHFDRFPNKYRSWWNFETLPEIEETDASFQNYICGEGGAIDYWMRLGADGFRLDVADELPDSFIAEIRKAVKRHGDDKILMGEVWEDASNKISYGVRRAYLRGEELDAVMNYPFRTAILDFIRGGDAETWMNRVCAINRHYPKPMLNLMMNMLSNHDTERALSVLAVPETEWKDRSKEWLSRRVLTREEYLRGVEMLKLAMVLQFTLPGLPCIYYGDEIGMQGFKDPFNRGFMRWDIPDENLLAFTRALAERRAGLPALRDGLFAPVVAADSVVAFLRRSEKETVAVALNRSDRIQTVRIPNTAAWILEPWEYRIARLEP